MIPAQPEHHEPPAPAGWDRVLAAGATPPLSPHVLELTRRAVADAVRAEHAAALAPVRRRRTTLLVLAAAAVLAVLAAALPRLGFFGATDDPLAAIGNPPTATVSAANYLLTVARRVPPSDLTPERPLWRATYVSTTQRADGRMETTQTSFWYGADRTYLQLDGGEIQRGTPSPFPLSTAGAGLSWQELRGLPTSPDELARVLKRKAGSGVLESSMLTGLLSAPITPQVRRAVFELLARQEGVRLVGAVQDSRGRAGTAIEHSYADSVWRTVMTDDGDVLEMTVAAPGVPLERTTYLAAGPAALPQATR